MLNIIDQEIEDSIAKEHLREQNTLELIASENFVSKAVLRAQGSILTNKYAEGYPHKRYYGGCAFVDEIEEIAINRAKKLFNVEFANVQPHSGSQANQAVFLALLNAGDCFLGMSLAAGGHLTHGAAPNLSGKWFKPVHYGVNSHDHLINFDEVEAQALEHKPKLIIAGGSAYSRIIDFAKFREIADKVGAYLLVDMAHIAGLVAAGLHPSPFPHAHIATSTTHKTLRGPRGGIILTNEASLAKKIDSAIFPGLQGGPLMHIIAAKAVAFLEASNPEFTEYSKQVINNAKELSRTLNKRGFDIIAGGTDNHLILVDLRNKNITGKDAEKLLEEAFITCNKNSIPFDQASPFITSGIRLGSPACTTRGMGAGEFTLIGNLIADLISAEHKEEQILKTRATVLDLCKRFPLHI